MGLEMKRLDYLEDRLRNLKAFLEEEKANDNNELYISDLNDIIKKVEAEIASIKFARNNPVVMVDK